MKKHSKDNPFAPYKSTYNASFDWPSDEFGFTIANKHLPVQSWLRNADSDRPCAKHTTYSVDYAIDKKSKDAPKSRHVDKQLSMEVRAMYTRYPYLMKTLGENEIPPGTELIEHAYHRRGPSTYQDEICKAVCVPTSQLQKRVRETKNRVLKDANTTDQEGGATKQDCECTSGSCKGGPCDKGGPSQPNTMEDDVDDIFDVDDVRRKRNSFCFPRSYYEKNFQNPLCYGYGACEDPDTHFAGPPNHDTFRRAGWNREMRGSTGKTEYQDYFSESAVEMIQKQNYNKKENYYRGNPNKPK